MNLVPIKFRKKLATRRILRVWSAVWCACLLTGVALTSVAWWNKSQADAEHRTLEAQAAPLRKLKGETLQLTREIGVIRKRESIVADITGIDQPLNYLGLVSHSAATVNEQMLVNKLTLLEAEEITARPKVVGKPNKNQAHQPQKKAKKIVELRLTGLATDDASIAAFLNSLRTSDAFSSVELKSSTLMPLPNGNGRQFEVICKR